MKIKGSKIFKILFLIALCCCLILIVNKIISAAEYNKCWTLANNQIKKENYISAIDYLKKAENYKENTKLKDRILLCTTLNNSKNNYSEAVNEMSKSKYLNAIDLFNKVSPKDTLRYKNSNLKLDECRKLYNEGNAKIVQAFLKKDDFQGAFTFCENVKNQDINYYSEIEKSISSSKINFINSSIVKSKAFFSKGNYKKALECIDVILSKDTDNKEASSLKTKILSKIKSDNTDNSTAKMQTNQNKVAYLTFDDGPSSDITPKILATLDKYNIKATFFVIGTSILKNEPLLKLEHSKGHVICNHTYSHDPDYLYASADNFLSDIVKNENLLKSVLPGYNLKLIRFPGGSKYRPYAIKKAVLAKGYHYADWDCLSRDAEGVTDPKELLHNVKVSAGNKSKLIVLMHDSQGKSYSAEALPSIIEYLKSQGYVFRQLS
ncbi:MAG: polysaccharide deacetylase family protein [Clostridiaceae bacterium]